MPGIRAAEVAAAGEVMKIVEQDLPEPGHGEVRVTVEACGICHSDAVLANGWLPGASFPLVPGHEVAGRIDALGEHVTGWRIGQRVGVGWFGGSCGRCPACRAGYVINCPSLKVPGAAYPGGYADALVVPVDALAAIPDGLSAAEAAPLMCAGVSTYNALRNSNARPGDLVAIQGLGGLGHLGVQYAAKMGFETVAIARGADKEPLARELGAHHYIDSTAQDVARALSDLGDAQVVLTTITDPAAMSTAIDGLRPRGQFILAGASGDSLTVSPLQLIMKSRSVVGHASGSSRDSEEALAFSVLAGVRARIEEYPLEQAAEGYDRMLSGAARFRVVLTTGK
jgi:D-arabinose 1-dehydrogenase-like Zn-dependent alcohol dehydrogenase